jgi:hypothetical protein
MAIDDRNENSREGVSILCKGKKVKNILAVERPDLAKEWHPTKNGDVTPYDRTVGSNKKVWWKCSVCSHDWKHVIRHRVEAKDATCPICSSLGAKNPKLTKEWHPTKNGELTPFQLRPNSEKKVWWQCSKNPQHEWEAIVYSRSEGNGCPGCSGRMATPDNCLAVLNPDLAKEWHPTKNGHLTPTGVTTGSNKKVWWKCLENPQHEWEAVINLRNRGSGCPGCSGRMATPDNCLAVLNPDLTKEWHPAKNGQLTPKNVTYGSEKKVWWQCLKNPEHIWKSNIYSRSEGNGCPHCAKHLKTSFPEQFLYFYLKKIFNEAENGSKISNSRKEMDIYIPSLNFAIEYDGKFYHQDAERDKEKDKIIHKKGYLLIRIREKGCPSLKNSTSVLYHRKNNKEDTLPDALQFILQAIISRYPLNDIQLQKIKNLSVDIQKDREAIKLLMAS